MKTAIIQHDIVSHDPVATQRRLTPMIKQAASAGARLMVLTQLYSPEISEEVDPIAAAPTEQFLTQAARRHDAWVVSSVPQRGNYTEQPPYTGMLVAPAGTVHRYDKLRSFHSADQDKHLKIGIAPLNFSIDDVSASLFIIYNLRFGNCFWANTPLTYCYIVIAHSPTVSSEAWRTVLRARSIEDQAYAIAINRVGENPSGERYVGSSRIIDPQGTVLSEALADREAVLIADVDPAFVRQVRGESPDLSGGQAQIPALASSPLAEWSPR